MQMKSGQSRREKSKLQLSRGRLLLQQHKRRELHEVEAIESCCCQGPPSSKDHSVGRVFSIVHAVSVLWASHGVILKSVDSKAAADAKRNGRKFCPSSAAISGGPDVRVLLGQHLSCR